MTRETLVVLDIDGTLLASAGEHHRIAEEVLARHGLDVLAKPWESYRNYTDSAVIDEVSEDASGLPVSAALLATLDEEYAEGLEKHLAETPIEEVPGARALLAALDATPGVRLAFATGSLRAMAEIKLGLLGVDVESAVLATGLEHGTREAIIGAAVAETARRARHDRFDVVSLGDGRWDETTAIMLGVGLVGVETGSHRFGPDAGLVVPDLRSVTPEQLVAQARPWRPAPSGLERIGTGAASEAALGFSRAVATPAGYVHVSGCSGLSREAGVPHGSVAQQLGRALDKAAGVLARAGLGLEDVVATRVYLVGDDFDEAGAAHGALLGGVRPACTMVRVAGLIDPDMRVELELTAYRAPA
ncbi:Rid family hydrolase [Nocardioides bruguierae]|uniref:Rid family hydrolase n=1 Tax=Nocardioides bruguierae TaxID=2945102 RepID=A0A9X2DAS7_9ACTN|nr:Rid family hydrolase [Nocardioides bruguierae]MCM0622467.1 Rid family hydrolase [Nocardioides bruguierae]